MLADRDFSGWFDLALLAQRGIDVVVRKQSPRKSGRFRLDFWDSFTSIAKLNGTTLELLLAANCVDRATVLQPGQLVYIPDVK